MHVDLVESLRCPRAHEDGWLVATTDEVVKRRIMRGVIGCPQCGAEWIVNDGVLVLDGSPPSIGSQNQSELVHHEALSADHIAMHDEERPMGQQSPDAERELRVAALLNLRDSRGAVAVFGESARLCDGISALTGVLLLAVNAPADVALAHSRLYAANQLPLGVGTMRGVVLDSAHSVPGWVASAVRALERGGRLIAPAGVVVPPEVEELGRDDDEWVGEVRVAASGLIPLRRGGRVE